MFQVAELLLFVTDNQTRAVVSLCEIAYLVGELWFFVFQVAELLLFVIDNQTRAVVSLCEMAYLVGES